jgi:PAS domain S-box-containing protein
MMDSVGTTSFGRLRPRVPADSALRPLAAIAGLALAYYATAVAGYALLMIPSPPTMAVLWPPNVLLFVAFLVTPLRLWPIVTVFALMTQLAVAATVPIPVGRSLAMFTGNLSQPLIAAGVLRWLGHRAELFETLTGVTAFVVVAAVAAPAIASLMSATALLAAGWITDPWAHWRMRFVTNMLSTLVLAPPLLIFLRWRTLPRPFAPRVAEFLILLAMLTASERLVESFVTQMTVSPLLFAPLPFLLWAAVRFGPAGLGLVLCFTALFRYFTGAHPGHELPDPPDAIVTTQLTLIAMSLPLLFLSTLLVDRRRSEEALRTGHSRYGLATNAGSVGVWDWDLTTNAMYIDPALKRFIGCDDSEIDNTLDGWARRMHPDDGGRVMAEVQAHIDGRTPAFEVQHRMLHKDGSIRWFLCRGVVVERVGGRATRMTGTDMDITLQKRAEAALEDAQSELARMIRLSDMGGLTATIAHEVNQPLCAIVANANAVLRWLGHAEPDAAQMRAALEDIVRDGKRAGELIRRTRALFERGEIDRQPIAINDVVLSATTLTRAAAVSGRISVHTELQPSLPTITADFVQLQQVFCNLIMNAVEAMSGVANRPLTLTIATRREDAGVHVTVADTGRGLEEDDAERVFRPLVTSRPDGMGIGLSMSRLIIEMHGGRLWAAPNPDVGATFHILLPPS